jgi:hypothetical protein
MSSYSFHQRCRPSGDFRIPQISEFLYLVRETLQLSVLYDSNSKPADFSEAGLEEKYEKESEKLLPGLGALWHFYTISPRKMDHNTIAVDIHTGTAPEEDSIDYLSISLGDKRTLPDFEFFEESIKIFNPFEAFLADDENEFQLGARDRQREIGGFTKPAIIRGLHYLDRDLAKSIGGTNYCLKAPAWQVDRFCEGVLIDLVPGIFDSSNPEHLEAQEKVMAYFDML